MPDRTLLVADDDPGLRESLERTQDGAIDLIVTDLKMPGLTGIEVLRAAKAIAPDVDVILLTAFGTVEAAVKALKEGAYASITTPFQRAQVLRLIRQALERRELIQQNRALQQRRDDLLRQCVVSGSSPAFRRKMT